MPLMLELDPKYSVREVQDQLRVVKTTTGEPIPLNEPLITFRSRDRHALAVLNYYRALCIADNCTPEHSDSIDNRIAAFDAYAREHPEAMKQPGITRGR